MKNIYSIKYCPIAFHDLVEIWDFLTHISIVSLYQFDGLDILLNGIPIMHIFVYHIDGISYVTYRTLRL